MEWPSGGHNGGEAIIGPDGYLYISTGDGTSGSDVNDSGQNLTDLHSVMMRLDVDHPDPGRNYSIPKDNPFVNTPGALPEIWAYGFRNPWRFSFDPENRPPWVGDVGQDLWEMIELSDKGANHGWSVMEGTHPFQPGRKRGPTPIVPPIVEHHHIRLPLYYRRLCLSGLEVQRTAGRLSLRRLPVRQGLGSPLRSPGEEGYVASGTRVEHGEDLQLWSRARRLFLCSRLRRRAYHSTRKSSSRRKMPPFPRKLSETGLFTSVREHKVAPGVMPYSINAPFWSDGAHKERFFALPGNNGD